MEEEIESTCRADEVADRELCLKNSPTDLATYESLKRLRTAIKSSDDVALPESGHYYDQLHAKIMAALDGACSDDEKIASESARPVQRAPLRGLAWPSIFRAAGVTMMIAIVSWLGLHQSSTVSTPVDAVAAHKTEVGDSFGRNIASVDQHEGAKFARDMGSFESEEDFVTEAAEARLQQISQHDADAMMRSLKM